MAKDKLEVDVKPNSSSIGKLPPVVLYTTGAVLIGYMIYRSGYESGVDVSNRVLRRHDKDVRRMKKEAAKREKQLRKELEPEEGKKKWKWWPW
jgi:hypothetical protein